MGRMTIDMLDGAPMPKRGDLLESNVGDKRQRTWFVLRVKPLRPTKGVPRCQHTWESKDGKKPVCCAKCKSPYWDREPKSPR